MRKSLLIVLVGLSAACSSPKYATNFRPVENTVYSHDQAAAKTAVAAKPVVQVVAVAPQENALASIKPEAGLLTDRGPVAKPAAQPVMKTYLQMSKTERKELRKQVRGEIKNYIKSQKEHVQAAKQAKALDHDLKLAAVFGAVGVVALLISGSADVFYIIGGIALIIGVIFFVKWLIRQ